MVSERDIILNLLGLATVIISVGLIFIGKWVRYEVITKALVAQVIALICIVIAAFMVKG